MSEIQNEQVINTETKHEWPHIPKMQWESVYWAISNTNISTFIFFIVILVFSIFANRALKNEKSTLRMIILNFISNIDDYISSSLSDKKFARSYSSLILWIFFIVLFWNIFGLIIDWLWSSISPNILTYLRPINSDLNTTLVLAWITVITFIGISFKYNWVWTTIKWYLFNFSWDNITEKCINVFVWWLHLIWVPSTLASLSLRLFGNIFAWIVLLWVITYLWHLMTANLFEIWRIITLPFWFFELFVAVLQSIVFIGLMLSYFKQNKSHH